MTQDSMNKLSLSGLTRRLQSDPRFMAYALAVYQEQEGFGEEELAQALGIMPEMLSRLAMCKRPEACSPEFATQVHEIADYTVADEARLANLLRQVSGLEKLVHRGHEPLAPGEREIAQPLMTGLLAVARDRDEADKDQEKREEE
ncbi:MAG: hypothetical protein IPM66_21675 [Acidobacteriota bacterium]|nr:MAG: hypothetical protein IPM66_21675 [Acidobacteriota bacterium]